MDKEQMTWFPKSSDYFDHPEIFFHPIQPEEYSHYGIDPHDIPMGTFAAKEHPTLLPSRFGGNAYGLGIMELSILDKEDTDFLEKMDFKNPQELGHHAKKINTIYQKLGLLIRFTSTGMRYFLIPFNLVVRSLQDIRTKADHIQTLVGQHIQETQTERLNIGLMTAERDILVHELTARFSTHRIFIFESLKKLRSWRTPLDLLILPKDFFEYLSEQKLSGGPEKPWSHRRLLQYAKYLSGKVYDLLERDGKFIVLAHYPCHRERKSYTVHFKSDEERKAFLLFSHVFKTRRSYKSSDIRNSIEIHPLDLCYYLKQFTLSDLHLTRLLNQRNLADLRLREIDDLPYLNLRLPLHYTANLKNLWTWVLSAYFKTVHLEQKSPEYYYPYWEKRLENDPKLPESLLVFVGRPRRPTVTLATLEAEVKASGMMGCSLPLAAEYRNTFRYVIDVLKILNRIRNHDFPKLPELELNRLRNPFDWKDNRNESFNAIQVLLGQIPRLEKLYSYLNPDGIEGRTISILDNINKIFLHGFTGAQLRELLLIVVGHTTMSRIVFGKLPAKTLKGITDRAQKSNYQEVVDLLRFCRLMSMGEIAAAFGEAFMTEHGQELFRLYTNAIEVATDPGMGWEKLHDLQISALGGVQNKAIREMMKFFNLFEFIDNWHEFEQKGPCQKEVLCDYDEEKLKHLDQVLELNRIATHFKEQFINDYTFGRSYFFRQFLDTEFHGTGHLFPKLGSRAGFIALWITVNVAGRLVINFNPILAGIPQDRHEARIRKIRETLIRIPIERLEPRFFEEIKEALDQEKPAFIFDSGIRLTANPETRVIDVSFVDVDENIKQIEGLIARFERSKLESISLKDFQDAERLFSELESFHRYLQQKECSLHCDVLNPATDLDTKNKKIYRIESGLRSIFLSYVMNPEEIYDALSVFAAHCPEILRFILPEFYALGNLVEIWPARRKQSLGTYAMRCLQKFQALSTKDREAFQERNTFYQLAKYEFGPLAGEGTGADHTQMDILENIVDRIRQRPFLYQAFTLALLFQDIGKIDKYISAFPKTCIYCTHAERGAAILERSDILERYQLDAQVRNLIVLLVRHHGLIGRVIQGEEPFTSLESFTEPQDDCLLDALVLHSILAAAAVQEGLMVSDLLDIFLHCRLMSLQIIRSKGNWQTRVKEILREKGSAVLDEFHPISQENEMCSREEVPYRLSGENTEEEVLLRGRRIAAFERLLRLLGVLWVDYQDLQMHLLNMPINFIYHKKKLKSIGLTTFERQMAVAAEILRILSSMKSGCCYYLLYCLDALGGSFRIYDFSPLARFLKPEECVKLLMLSFYVFHHHFGKGVKGGLLSFRYLSQSIEKKHGVLRYTLQDLPFIGSSCNEEQFSPLLQALEYLTFEVSSSEVAISLNFKDPVQLNRMLEHIQSLNTHDELNRYYQEAVFDLSQKLSYKTEDYQEELYRVFKSQQKKINDRMLKSFQEKLSEVENFSELQTVQDEIEAEQAEVHFSEEQQIFLREMLEYHRTRIRGHYLDTIYEKIHSFSSKKALLNYWNELKYELLSYRSYAGKEYESLIAEFIDQKLIRMGDQIPTSAGSDGYSIL